MSTFLTRGLSTAKFMIIGDGPFAAEVQSRVPFSSRGSEILPLELHKTGVGLNSCYSLYIHDRPVYTDNWFTTVKKKALERDWSFAGNVYAAPRTIQRRQELFAEIARIDPDCILLCGELPLWMVTGNVSLSSCRGSIYPSLRMPNGKVYKTVCTWSPSDVQAVWERKPFFDRDIERAVTELQRGPAIQEPPWKFLLQASSDDYHAALDALIARMDAGETVKLSLDIETIRHEIACIGIAWSKHDAMCVPFRTSREYWTLEEELALIIKIKRLVEHPNAHGIGQNFLYDAQYLTVKWGAIPRLKDDTMDMQHVCFVGMPKALHTLASVYCDFYQYWKDELDDYKSAPKDDNQFFAYNCKDCCYTFEVAEALENLLKMQGLYEIYRERIDNLYWTTLRMTLRGIRVNIKQRDKLSVELLHAANARQEFLDYVIGRPFNPKSTPQMKQFFYEEMGVKPEKSRTTKKDSLGAEILLKIPEEYPLLEPITEAIIELRSIGVFSKTFVNAQLDFDGRMRTFFKMTGPETYRFASSENAFGRGANLMNIPKGDRARTRFVLPNIRNLYVPDPGMEIFDTDLSGADAQVVAWECDCQTMKQLFREKKKIAAFAAREIFGSAAGSDGKNEPYYTRAKMGGHATNYGAWPGTVAKALGISVKEAEKFQNTWFGVFPEIKQWHERVERELQSTRTITNAFGYRKIFFGRLDRALPEALAWIPQSTVAIVTAKAMVIIDAWELVELLLQVHDSLVFQLPIQRPDGYVEKVLDSINITIPYADPLVIPWGCKSSTAAWGYCG